MAKVRDVASLIEQLAPPHLAESWDNVGLLVGRVDADVNRVMTCLTITADSAAEAVAQNVDLIVTHHPLPFRPLNRLTTETPEGRYLLKLIEANIAIYSAHTAYDSAREGINQRLAEGLILQQIAPLEPSPDVDEPFGAGRYGENRNFDNVRKLVTRLKEFLNVAQVRVAGDPDGSAGRVAIACGSAGEMLEAARQMGCDVMITGEASFHTCLAAEAAGMALVLAGHFASEHFAMRCLAEAIADEFDELDVWASREEQDPLRVL